MAGYPNDQIYQKERHISSGEIKNILGFEFEHTIDTRAGSSGAPMIDLETGGVMGIHIGYDELLFNLGIIIRDPIYEFIKLNQNKQNEITLKLEIKKEDINK